MKKGVRFSKLLILIVVAFFLFNSCKSKRILEPKSKPEYINYEKYVIDTSCINYQNAECEFFFLCHYSKFMQAKYPVIFNLIDSKNKVGDLLECASKINNQRDSLFEKSNALLSHFYISHFNKAVINKGHVLITRINKDNQFYRVLDIWNSTKAFEICILYMSKNSHDSMGHGDCSNLGFKFLYNIVLPKIKSINGQVPDIYLEKNMPGDRLSDYDDCFDTYFNYAYPRLKKAWEEGKIELKTNTNH